MEDNEKNYSKDIEEQNIDNKYQDLTNEQKLKYLSDLIQNAERKLEENGLSKTLIKKDDSLKR